MRPAFETGKGLITHTHCAVSSLVAELTARKDRLYENLRVDLLQRHPLLGGVVFHITKGVDAIYRRVLAGFNPYGVTDFFVWMDLIDAIACDMERPSPGRLNRLLCAYNRFCPFLESMFVVRKPSMPEPSEGYYTQWGMVADARFMLKIEMIQYRHNHPAEEPILSMFAELISVMEYLESQLCRGMKYTDQRQEVWIRSLAVSLDLSDIRKSHRSIVLQRLEEIYYDFLVSFPTPPFMETSHNSPKDTDDGHYYLP